MDASHFEIFFETSSSQLTHSSKINDSLTLKNFSHDTSSTQLVVIKLLHICSSLLDETTFPKDWFDLLILRNK